MPKRKTQQEDQSYEEGSPTKYRRYTKKTKTKYCFLVKRLGWKPSSAAKLLKIKCSTAKMILKNFQHPDFQQFGEILKQKYKSKKLDGSNVLEKDLELVKVEGNQQLIYYFVYFGLDPMLFSAHNPEE